jgi:[2Fe-2S] binding domain
VSRCGVDDSQLSVRVNGTDVRRPVPGTPGFIMTITALLRSERVFDAVSAREALVGNICRCTGYTSIVDAFLAAQGMRDGVAGPGRPQPDQPPGDHAHG